MYRVELKVFFNIFIDGAMRLFLMYRVELKGQIGFSYHVRFSKFLMYRVELKGEQWTDLQKIVYGS